MSVQPVRCRALPAYRVWLRFSDGAEGVADLSHLAGRGVFAAWLTPGFFERAFIDPEAGTLAWPGGLDLDPDVLYARATGAAIPGADAA